MPLARLRRLLRRDEHRAAHHLPRQRTSIRRRILWHSLLLTAFTVAILSFLSCIVAHSFIENRVLSQLATAVASRESLLSRSLQFDRERVSLLASRGDVRSTLSSGTESAVLSQLREELLGESVPVRGMTIFDAAGKAHASVGEGSPSFPQAMNGTALLPAFNALGRWESTSIYAPIRGKDNTLLGVLAVRYDPTLLLTALGANATLGDSSEFLILRPKANGAAILYAFSMQRVRLGGNLTIHHSLLQQAAEGRGGLYVGQGDSGESVLGAYRSIPATGWGLLLTVDASEAFLGWERFVLTILLIDGFLLALSALVGAILSRELSSSLLQLAWKMSRIKPGRWEFRRSVRTGDEVEILDYVASELTTRLRSTYRHLEREVASRSRALRRQYLLDRTILERFEEGVFVTDRRGKVVDANPAASKLLGITHEQILGGNIDKILQIARKDDPQRKAKHPVLHALREGSAFHTHHGDRWSVRRKDGESLPAQIVVLPLTSGRSCFGGIVTVQDLREEQRIDDLKSEFISLASHQLRTPLSSLRWYLELLRGERKQLTKEQREYVTQMDVASARMARLLDELFHVTRLEGGTILVEQRECNMNEVLRECRDEWLPLAAQKKLRLTFSLPGKPVRLKTDPTLLRLVLQNLFTNATKYSKEGGQLQVGLTIRGRSAFITVRDGGIGIPADEQKHVFQKFFRARNARKADAEGSGLGLYLAKTIVENLGGKISFESSPGGGTTFTVRLPKK